MSPLLLAVSSLCAAFSGFTALGLAMGRHWEDSMGRGSEPGTLRRWLRLAGTAGLALSLLASLALQGPAQGWVLWLGMLTAGALAVVPMLSYAPRWAPTAGIAGAAAMTLSGILGAWLR
jgi:hypothetical protein